MPDWVECMPNGCSRRCQSYASATGLKMIGKMPCFDVKRASLNSMSEGAACQRVA